MRRIVPLGATLLLLSATASAQTIETDWEITQQEQADMICEIDEGTATFAIHVEVASNKPGVTVQKLANDVWVTIGTASPGDPLDIVATNCKAVRVTGTHPSEGTAQWAVLGQ